jgi:hypothetical protein
LFILLPPFNWFDVFDKNLFFLCGKCGEIMQINLVCQDIFSRMIQFKEKTDKFADILLKSYRILKLVTGPEVLKRAEFRRI